MTELLLTLAVATLLRATALAAAVALVLAVFRIRATATRHTAWVAVLVVMLLLPVLTRVVPAIRVSVPETAVPFDLDLAAPVRQIDTPLPALPASMTPPQKGSATLPVAPGPTVPNSTPHAPAAPVRWDVIASAGYLAVATLLLIRFIAGLLHLASIRRSSQRVTTADGQVIWESARVATPVTIGLVTPRVIVPASWRDWPPQMLTAVLAHEREHCRRRDPLIAMLARLNTTLFWFHPLSWWLERRLATLAEHACDEAALTQVPRRQYAQTLLDIAATARRHNGRLVWQGVGVDGDGRLGQRIDRVLSGQLAPRTSRVRRGMAAASCAVAIAVAVACQQQVKVEPLREDPELAAKMKADVDRNRDYWAAQDMTLEQAAALEKTLEQNPEDEVTRGRLLNFYTWTGKNKQSWNDNVAARRRHALWLVDHHPESRLVGRAPVTKETDPAGYAQLRQRWLAVTAAPDTDAKVLSNAAWFFALPVGHPMRPREQQDLRQAEALLMRARKSAPPDAEPTAGRLADLYVSALAPRSGTPADPALAAWAKQRLDEITDADVLVITGARLYFQTSAPRAGGKAFGPELRELGRSYVDRARRMGPSATQTVRAYLRLFDAEQDPDLAFFRAPRSEWPGIVAKSTGLRKLRQLTTMAGDEYLTAEYYDWRASQPAGSRDASPDAEQDKRAAAEGFAHAKEYARQAIDLAESLTGAGVAENAFSAHHTLGLALLHEGNRRGAVDQMQQAAKLPAPDDMEPIGRWASGNEYKLVFYLLKNGERQTIIDYFERAAQGRNEVRRRVMLASAAAVRDGRMPEHYQYLYAHGGI
jgi:beta-lactamase regulating signal transducer with metallopeptidase domain